MEQKLCLSCQKPIEQHEGKRAKKYCNDACRASHWSKTHSKKGQRWVRKEVYDAVVKERDEAILKIGQLVCPEINSQPAPEPVFYETPKQSNQPQFIMRKDHIQKDKELGVKAQKKFFELIAEEIVAEAEKAPVIKDKGAKRGSKKDYPASVGKILETESAEDIPVREKGESGLAYSIRLSEWKDNQKTIKQ